MLNRLLCVFLILCTAVSSSGQSGEEPALTISLKAIAGMKYDIVRFAVKPGTTVKIILSNNDEMEHNLVFTKPGARQEVVDAALALGPSGPKQNYIPSSTDILGFIPVLNPGQRDSLILKVPRKTGVYPYVCTFPGHGLIMYGAMHVTHGVMPQMTADLDIPPHRRKENMAELPPTGRPSVSGHPYTPTPPYLYRVLLPNAGPAAIAVHLPHQLSYCWDAGACRLRYAWIGEFLDLTDYWTIKGELYGKILGMIFYRDQTAYPLRIGSPENIPAVTFKGYRLIRQYPEFHYSINGQDVFELIHPKPDGSGLIRTFRLPGVTQALWFVFAPEDGVQYQSSTGEREEGKLKFSIEEAQKFTITMTKVAGSDL